MDTNLYQGRAVSINERRAVLIIAYSFPPLAMRNVQRVLKFAKYLPDYGWKPIVLTSTPSEGSPVDMHLLQQIKEDVHIYGSTESEPVRLQKSKHFPIDFLSGRSPRNIGKSLTRFTRQPDRFNTWQKEALVTARQLVQEEQVEVILAMAPPFRDFVMAHQLSKEFDLPFVIDYQTPWNEDPKRSYGSPFHKAYNIRLETEILTYTSKIINPSRHLKELMLRRYGFLEHNDIRIIPGGYDSDDFKGFHAIRPHPEKFTITTTMAFEGKASPIYFLKALRAFLAKHPEARPTMEARLTGLLQKRHAKYIRKYKLEDCVFMTGFIPHQQKVRQMLESDVLWLTHDATLHAPEELYEYLGARKPLLVCAPDGICKSIAQECQAALVAAPTNVKAMTEAIEHYYNLWQHRRLPVPKEQFAAQYDYKTLSADMSRELGMALSIA